MEMVHEDLSDQRVSYEKGELEEKSIKKNPFEQFKIWFDQAHDTKEIREANAMILCTASKNGFPSARPVLLKEFDEDGFIFFTNYESRKSKDLKENPFACLCFYWEPMERTVRIEGEVEMISEEQSIHYFQSRPRDSQLGAWASRQSTVVQDRDQLTKNFEAMQKKFDGLDVLPKPEYWGGWRVKALTIEFWQGRKSRLHDRLKFTRETTNSTEWKLERLSP